MRLSVWGVSLTQTLCLHLPGCNVRGHHPHPLPRDPCWCICNPWPFSPAWFPLAGPVSVGLPACSPRAGHRAVARGLEISQGFKWACNKLRFNFTSTTCDLWTKLQKVKNFDFWNAPWPATVCKSISDMCSQINYVTLHCSSKKSCFTGSAYPSFLTSHQFNVWKPRTFTQEHSIHYLNNWPWAAFIFSLFSLSHPYRLRGKSHCNSCNCYMTDNTGTPRPEIPWTWQLKDRCWEKHCFH